MEEAYASHNRLKESLYAGTSRKILDKILENENSSVDGISGDRAVRVTEVDDKGELWGYLKHSSVLIRIHYFYSSLHQQMLVHVADESRTLNEKDVKNIAAFIKDIALKATEQIHQNPSKTRKTF